jgi:cytochrome o ubiquinol oxidase subunit 3
MSEAALTERQQEQRAADDKTLFGFWTYIMTDCVLFASLFATYAVLHNNTFGGPGAKSLFDLNNVLIETMALLTSSFTMGLAMLAVRRKLKTQTQIWLIVTFLLGLLFLLLELNEFHSLAAEGNSWRRSGFLSAFYTLVATHGLHITVGLSWIVAMRFKVAKVGFTRATVRRLGMLSIFWHFLDVVWIFIFTVVYMLGAL